MKEIMNYVKPELVVVVIVLYIVGIGLKKSSSVFDKYIPVILGVLGMIICGIYVFATSPLETAQDIAIAVFTSIVQGILTAGASKYVNQILKQANKE